MRLILSLSVLLWCGFAHAQEDAPLPFSATELSAASAEELDARKVQAQQANRALATLLEGVTSDSAPAASKQSDKLSTVRSAKPRPHEQAIAQIPSSAAEEHKPQLYKQIRQQLEKMPTGEARALIEEFLSSHPFHREALITLARLQIIDNQPSAALLTLDGLTSSVAARNHPDWQPWFWAGTAYLALGEIDSARRMLDVAVAKEGNVVEIWVQLAVLEQELDNHGAALQYIGIAEQVDAEAAQVYLNRAYSLERLGEFDAALDAYQRFMASKMTPGAEALRPSVMRRMALLAQYQQESELDRRS